MEVFGAIIVTIACIIIGLYGSVLAQSDVDARRKNHDAGTHDYYGNKIDE
jgi:hypothetical protein